MKSKIINGIALGLLATLTVAAPATSKPGYHRHSTPTTLISQAVAASGKFVRIDHRTVGRATIINEDGNFYLELDEGFQTDMGPDLLVLLHQDDVPRSYSAGKYVNLGRLKKVRGEQRYAISGMVDLEEVGSVVIWCRRFNVTFGYANLNN